MIETLLAPFGFPFMQNAFLICLMVAAPVAMLSCFLVLKGWALMGDAVSHAILPGIVLASILGAPLILGAFVAGMATTVATGWLTENSRIKQDTVMGIVFSGMFGLGIVMFTAIPTDAHLDHILFGNLLGVGRDDLWTAGVISAGVGAALLLGWRDLLVFAFDPAHARAIGLRVGLMHYGLLAMLSLMVVAVLTASGLVLAVGLLIAPGAIAFLLVRRFAAMLAVAVAVCLTAMVGGTYVSFHLDSAPGPTIILILSALFALALAWRMRRTARARA